MCKCNSTWDCTVPGCKHTEQPKVAEHTQCAFRVGDMCYRRDSGGDSPKLKCVYIGASRIVFEYPDGLILSSNYDGYWGAGFYIDPPKRTKTVQKMVFWNPDYKSIDSIRVEDWSAWCRGRGVPPHQLVSFEVPV